MLMITIKYSLEYAINIIINIMQAFKNAVDVD